MNKKMKWYLLGIAICTIGFTTVLLMMLSFLKNEYHKELNNDDTKFASVNQEVRLAENVVSEEITEVATTEEITTEEIVPVWVEFNETVIEEAPTYVAPEDVSHPYFIKVNRAANCVTVYGIDEAGEYSIPVKAIVCSCGREGHATITGENYVTTDKYEWRNMVDGTYAQCAFRIWNGYMFHSIPYMSPNGGDLEEGQFNLLGDFSSLGCIRVCSRDAKWIYDNCPSGTKVTIYDDEENPGPLGKPEMIKIPENSPNKGWDPTDSNPENPWLACNPQITGTKDITVNVGESVNLLAGISATDTCGNDITDSIELIGRYSLDLAGKYSITYKVVDLLGKECKETVTLEVK